MAVEYRITIDGNGITVTHRIEPDAVQPETNDDSKADARTGSYESLHKSPNKKSGSKREGSGGDEEEPTGGPVAKPGSTGGQRMFKSNGDTPGIFIGPIIFTQSTDKTKFEVNTDNEL